MTIRKSNETNKALIEQLESLKRNNLDLQDCKANQTHLLQESIQRLELELAQIHSKQDQTTLDLNEAKTNYLNQLNIVSRLKLYLRKVIN